MAAVPTPAMKRWPPAAVAKQALADGLQCKNPSSHHHPGLGAGSAPPSSGMAMSARGRTPAPHLSCRGPELWGSLCLLPDPSPSSSPTAGAGSWEGVGACRRLHCLQALYWPNEGREKHRCFFFNIFLKINLFFNQRIILFTEFCCFTNYTAL